MSCTTDAAFDTFASDLTLMSHGLVRTSTLAVILRTEHGLSARDAASSLERALLVSGYETCSALVAGADAPDIIDAASP